VKRFLVVLALAGVAGATYVATAPGSQTAAPTLASLNKKITLLTRKVKAEGVTIAALKKAENGVKTEADDAVGFLNSCLLSTGAGVLPINQFGDPNATFGYHYQKTTTVGDEALTTALDVDGSTTPGAFIQAVDPTCVTPAGALRKAGALSEHRASLGVGR
jgi:hypothetical protein